MAARVQTHVHNATDARVAGRYDVDAWTVPSLLIGSSPAPAQQLNKKTSVRFDVPVEIPGIGAQVPSGLRGRPHRHGRTTMERIGLKTSMGRCTLFAALLAVVIGSSSLGVAQGSDDSAIDQAQRAVRERIVSQDNARRLTVQFGPDARTEFPSNTDVRVSGTGSAVRATDRMARPFSYEAVVNSRNSNVSAVRYDWRGDWYNSDGNGSVFGRG